MRAKITLAIGLLVFSSGACWLVACSSNDTKDGGADGSTADTGDMDTGATDTGTTDTGVKDAGPQCNKSDGGAACINCCRTLHSAGNLYLLQISYICACQGNKCPQCANNICATDASLPTQGCNDCTLGTLNPDGGACYGPVAQACLQNKDCAALLQCNAGCN